MAAVNLPKQISRRASEVGLFASCVKTPSGKRLWSFRLNADDIIYIPQFDTYRPMEAVVDDVPEHKALWFLNAYDQELYDDLIYTGDIKPGVQWRI